MALLTPHRDTMHLGLGCLTIFLLMSLKISLAYLLTGGHLSFLRDGEPKDKVISSGIFNDDGAGGKANLVLTCRVTGDPIPSITWYRNGLRFPMGKVTSDGTLALNVTEEIDVSHSGFLYHCEATIRIGPDDTTTATIRSRNANITYTFFEGFRNMNTSTKIVIVLVGNPASLECDVLHGNPPPEIAWYDDLGLVANSTFSSVSGGSLYVEGSRYLNFRTITNSIVAQEYHCRVTNALINREIRSPTTYRLNTDLESGILVEYRGIGDLVGIVGKTVRFVYSSAYKKKNMYGSNGVTLSCPPAHGTNINTVDGIKNIIVPAPMGENNVITLSCLRYTADGIVGSTTGTLTIIVFVPARITSPAANATELIDRNIIVGEINKTFTCDVEGIPEPTLTWYYNGKIISKNSDIIVIGNSLIIPDTHVLDSGIYQCFVKNGVRNNISEDRRSWIIKVKEKVIPSILPLATTNPSVVEDPELGALLVAPVGTLDLDLVAVVNSVPCPTVQWIFNGTSISASSTSYSFINPCSDSNSVTPYNFTLTINNHNVTTSGFYSAVFDNGFSGIVTLPHFFITIPVALQLLGINLMVEGLSNSRCLPSGDNVILSCITYGYPRPKITFRKDAIAIFPSMSSRIQEVNFYQIKVNSVNAEDEGSYTCEAVDATTGTYIPLLVPRTFTYCTRPDTSIFSTPTVMQGQKMEITCNITGSPIPTVTWMRNRQLLASEGGIEINYNQEEGFSKVTVQYVNLDHSGVYSCSATNPSTTASSCVMVKISLPVSPLMLVLKPEDAFGLHVLSFVAVSLCASAVFQIILITLIAIYYFREVYAKKEKKKQ